MNPVEYAIDAARLANDNEDSATPGSKPAHFNHSEDEERSGGGRGYPGTQPDEIVPGKGDNDVPSRAPDEVAPDQGDFDRPDSSPVENPPLPDTEPVETPPD